MKNVLLLAIRCYQRYLSPRKGFSCTYRVHTGCASCSTLGYRAIRRYGSVAGLIVLRQRLTLCSATYRRLHPPRPVNYQAGECDFGCDAGCIPDCNMPGSCDTAGNCLDCADCLPERKGRRESTLGFPPLPPRSHRRRP